jgi:hypothetical protein
VAPRDTAVEAQEVHRRRADELGHEERRGLVVDVLGRAELLDHAVVHHDDLVAHLHGLELVVGDIDGRGPHPVVERAQFLGHPLAELGVERAERFVHQEALGVAHDRAAERHALPVAARKPAHRPVEQMLEPEDARDLVHLLAHAGARHALAHQRIADVAPHVHVRVEREHLEDEGDVALARGLAADLLAVDPDLARGRQFEPGDHPQRRRLAAARGAEEHEELPVGDGEGRALHGGEGAEFLAEVADGDLGHALTPGNG